MIKSVTFQIPLRFFSPSLVLAGLPCVKLVDEIIPEVGTIEMEKGFYDNEDFELLLGDILNDSKADNNSCGGYDDKSVSSISSQSAKISEPSVVNKPAGRKYTQERKKRRIDVVDPNGSVMEFSCTMPFPRILKTDFRRSYANMYTNVMNSGDFSLVFGFFDTFCIPSVSNTICRSFKINNEVKTFSVQRIGLLDCIIYWYYNLYAVPDATMFLTDSVIITDSSSDESRVSANYTFRATKIYDTPVELICNPFNDNEKLRDAIATKTSESRKRLEVNKNQRRAAALQESIERKEWMRFIIDSVSSTFKSFKLKADPHPIHALGSFTLHLDSQFRITQLDIKSGGDPNQYCNYGTSGTKNG